MTGKRIRARKARRPDVHKPKLDAITITIILANYNHARFLDTSLGAIVGQTRPADEIIVIDDGSTDNSLEVIKRFASENRNIRVISNGVNRGLQYSISRALGAATSEWIVWASADDKLLPTFLERGVEAITANPDSGVVFSRLATFADDTGVERHYTGAGHGMQAFNIGPEMTHFTPDKLMARLSSGYLWLSGNTAIVKLECLLDVGAFIPDLKWHSDWFAFYAVALRHGACGIPETLAMMRVVPNTYSSSGMNDSRQQNMVLSSLLDLLRRPDFADLRAKFRARPCLFSPFSRPMIRALIFRPQDWDILLRLVCWYYAHLNMQYRARLSRIQPPRGMRMRVKRYAAAIIVRLLNCITPTRWRHDRAGN